ncbi:multidrug resistance-associated protein 5 [Aplysia californica]|uniref:Multidrug resistance-associated protein 5 n=1 Tax=Aplysia californica TaxID=6500 RepID=A0ABM1VZP8_APLCA|nr:multidrug resistance-associated protein 5 [Aplysia californica]
MGKKTKANGSGGKVKNGLVRSISQALDGDDPDDHAFCLGVSKVPVSRAGLLSRASFWWMWRIMIGLYRHGFKCLFNLTWWEEDSAEHNAELLEKSWQAELQAKGPCQSSLGRALRSAYKPQLLRAVVIILITLSFSFIGSACVMRLLLDHISSANPDNNDNTTNDNDNIWRGVAIVLGLIVCELCRSFTFSLTWSFNYLNGTRGRAAAVSLLYRKILRLRSLQDKKIGELVNMFSHDGQRVFEAMVNGPFIVGGPFIFVAGAVYLTVLMGAWALVGIGTYILLFVIIKFLSDGIEHFRKIAMDLTGQRVGLMTEVLTCMKLIKMNGWEPSFIGRITTKRKEERKALERGSFFKSVVTSLVPMIPVIASVFMFLGYILSGNHLDASRAFTVISVFYAMSFALATALYGVQTLIDVSVAMTRYKDVLLMPERTQYTLPKEEDVAVEVSGASLTWEAEDDNDCEAADDDSIIAGLKPGEVGALSASSPTLSHRHVILEPRDHPDLVESSSVLLPKVEVTGERDVSDLEGNWMPSLHEVDMTVKKGELVGVCGMKGSGKSSLLAALLGRMQLLEGEIKLSGSMAFLSQEPWIMNGTARENILFGRDFDKDRYDRIIKATKLDKDFETFSAGDEVEIGDRGLTLSGGQKQRVCLARALYSQCDVYLLDDPLSAVDVNMGRHIFAQCIKTILHDKTIFMVTHHLEYLPKCDKVLLLQDGRVVSFGSHSELMASGGQYAELFTLYNTKYDRILKERMKSKTKGDVRTVLQRGFSRVSKKTLTRQLTRMSTVTASVQHQFSVVSSTSVCAEYENVQKRVDIEDLVSARDQPDCQVRMRSYASYIRAMGGVVVFVFLLASFIVSIAIQSLTTGYLAYWLNQGAGHTNVSSPSNISYDINSTVINSNSTTNNIIIATPSNIIISNNNNNNSSSSHSDVGSDSAFENPHVNMYALVYGMFLLATLVILVLRSLVFVKILLKASSSLHRSLTEMTLRSPMKFFDTTPIGIILNRFAADMDEIDVRLPANCELFLQNIFLVLSALLLISVVFPWDLLAILPLAIVFCLLAWMFAPVLQRLKFMDNVTRSPCLSHMAASVEGIATISSFNQGERFYLRFCELLNRNSVPFFLFYAANRWLAVFLDSMTVIVTGATGFLVIFTLSPENSSQAGLALSFAIQITSLVQYTLRLSMETMSRFASVQRIQDYVETLQPEGSMVNNPVEIPPSWPSEGHLNFRQYKMRYLDGQPAVIKGISLNIQPREKIGIVGNSGSGKSSLGVGMFRLVEAAAGTIMIDQINIRDVPLEVLRSRLSILVQDPVLFTGTVRYNLDPSGTITSDDIFWQALDKCHMRTKIQSLDGGLETLVEENGRNFSMGERQLLCLARTLLRNTKILVLDEATSSIDATTESLVQQTIRECFRNCTVLMIAHRINTVWDCDKVLVMEAGKAVEFNHPSVLLQKSFSRFKNMFDVMKSTPRGASVNEDPPQNERTSYPRPSTSPRLTSASHLRMSSTSPLGDLSYLRDSVIYDDDDADAVL